MTMAPSTSMPTVSTRPKSIMLFIVLPVSPAKAKAIMKDVGMATPTSSAERTPRAATQTTMTRMIAVMMEFSSEPMTVPMRVDSSKAKST